MKRYFDCFGDEVTAADEDDCTAPKFLRNLRKHPDPRDPDSVLADADWAEGKKQKKIKTLWKSMRNLFLILATRKHDVYR